MKKLALAATLMTLTLAACSTQTLPEQQVQSQGITVQNWTARVVNWNTVIKNNGNTVVLKGINWFGLDGSQQMGGTWTSHVQNGVTKNHDLDFWFTKIKALGFNAIRIPLSADTIWQNHSGSNTMLNTVIQKANQYDMYVVLGYQTCSPNYLGGNLVGDPSTCPDRTWNLSYWLSYMNRLALVAKNNPNVVAIDLFNEPHKLSWATWKGYAEQAITEIEKVYSTLPGRSIMYFVEGTGGTPNWGADITPAATPANRLFATQNANGTYSYQHFNKIVYSPHFYGKWVTATQAVNIVKTVVDSNNGNGVPVIIGEFGMVPSATATGGTQWGADFINGVKYKASSYFYWALNANEYDGPYGILRNEANGNSNWCIAESSIITTIRDNYSIVAGTPGLTISPTTPLNTVCY